MQRKLHLTFKLGIFMVLGLCVWAAASFLSTNTSTDDVVTITTQQKISEKYGAYLADNTLSTQTSFYNDDDSGSGSGSGSGSNSNDCCDQGDKPTDVTMEYVGGGCSSSNNNQGSKFECDSYNGGLGTLGSIYVIVSEDDDGGGDRFFTGTVPLNGQFTFRASNAGEDKFPSKVFLNIYSSQGGTRLQRLNVHMSCSAPIVINDQFGGLIMRDVQFQNGVSCTPPVVEVCPTPIINAPSGQICPNDPVTFSAPDLGFPCLTYTWSFGANASPSVATGRGPHTVTYFAGGSKIVSLTIDNGCTNGSGTGGSSGSSGSSGSNGGSIGSGSSSSSSSSSGSGSLFICGSNGTGGSSGSSGSSGSTGGSIGGSGSAGSGSSGSSGSSGINGGGSGDCLPCRQTTTVFLNVDPNCGGGGNTATIGNRVWNDANANGIQDPGEQGLQNVPVQLKNCSNTVLQTAFTNSAGNYSFSDLNPGCYRIGVIVPPGFNVSPQDVGGDETDSDINPSNNMTGDVNLVGGQTNNSVDIGLNDGNGAGNIGSIGNLVFNDLDQDGVQDPGEPGVPNVPVQLKNCSNTVLNTTFTDGNGNYTFGGLQSGCYRIGIIVPPGFSVSPQNATGDNNDSDISQGMAMTDNINLAPGENDPSIDAGIFQPGQGGNGSIGDLVFNDTDQDGVQDPDEQGVPNVPVQLKDCNNNVLQTTFTNGSGNYSFNGLNAGCYRVGITLPSGYQVSPANNGNDNFDSDIIPGMNMTADVNLGQGQNNPSIDAGIFQPNTGGNASLGDLVFNDLDRDGVQDSGEPGVPNVPVQLKDCSNNVLQTTFTNSSGNYSFTGLNAGCYVVGITPPAGFVVSPKDQGGNDNTDSDINAAMNMTDPVNLVDGQNNPSLDAGIYESGGGGNDCDGITFTPGNGQITIGGLTAPVVGIQVFDMQNNWATVFNCAGNCTKPTTVVGNLGAGNYQVKVNFFNAAWSPICEKQLMVTVGGGGGTPTLTVNDVTVNENAGTATLQICVDGTSGSPMSVQVATSNGSAQSGADYGQTFTTATIQPGQTCTQVTVPINDDFSPEPTEMFNVNLSNPTNATVGDPTGTVTILDDDSQPTPTVTINDVTVNENAGTATLQICADGTSNSPMSVNVMTSNGSATSGSDYSPVFTVATIQPGQTCTQVTVPITDDFNPEPTEMLNVNLSNPNNANIGDPTGTVTILDDDSTPTPSLTVNDITVNENAGTATLQVCASSPSGSNITVQVSTSNGTATNGSDYNGVFQTATIPAGQTCTNVTVPIVDDQTEEPTESLNVNLNNPTGATIADPTGTITILDDDQGTGDCDAVSIVAGNGQINISGLTAPIVMVQAFDGSWNQVFNCAGNCNTPNETISGLSAGTYYVKVNFFNASWGTICEKEAYVTVGGGGGTPSLTINDVTVNENAGTSSLQICASSPSGSPITVQVSTSDGSAGSGSDYNPTFQTATIPAGQTCTTVTVPIVDDQTQEPTEVFNVNLSNPTGATVADPTGTVTILDNDNGGGINCNNVSIAGGSGQITVSGLSAPIVMVQAFDGNWNQVFNCAGNCNTPNETISGLSAGTYYVKVNFLNANWGPICEKEAYVPVTGGGGTGVLTVNEPNDMTLTAPPGQTGMTVTFPPATATTTCPQGGASVTQISGPTSGSFFPIGTTQVCWRGTDNCGNVETECMTITVNPSGGGGFPDPNKCYRIVNRASGKVMDAQQTHPYLNQWTWDGTSSQVWKFEPVDNGHYKIVSQYTAHFGKVVDIWKGVQIDGGLADLINYTGEDCQKFSITDLNNGYYHLVAKHSGKALKLAQSPGGNGTRIIQNSINNNFVHQQWKVEEVPCATNLISSPTLDFVAAKKDGTAELRWVNNTGHINDYFIIERSANGNDFAKIGTVDAKGEAEEMMYFEEFDSKPIKGENYYRLTLVYADGTQQISGIRMLNFSAAAQFELFPNPARDFVNVQLGTDLGDDVHIAVFNQFGQLVKEAQSGNAEFYRLELEGIESGFYYVRITAKDRRSAMQKMVVERLR